MDLAISTLLDFLLVAILGLSIYLGFRHGLIRSAISLVGSVIALVLALVFSSGLGNYIDAKYVNAPMRSWVINQCTVAVEDVSVKDIDFDDLFARRPEFFTETCTFLSVDVDEMQTAYEELKADGVDNAKSAIVTRMVDPMSAVISRVLAFGVIFLAAMIAISVITLFSKFLTNLPIVKKLDKLGGVILGIVTGALISFIVVAVISTGSKYVLRDYSAQRLDTIREKTVLYKLVLRMDPLTGLFEAAD